MGEKVRCPVCGREVYRYRGTLHVGSSDCLARFAAEGAEPYDEKLGPKALAAALVLADVFTEVGALPEAKEDGSEPA